MGFLEFLLTVFVICVLAGVFTWAITTFVPSAPGWIIQLVWGLAVVLILVLILQATGLMNYDPKIPRVK